MKTFIVRLLRAESFLYLSNGYNNSRKGYIAVVTDVFNISKKLCNSRRTSKQTIGKNVKITQNKVNIFYKIQNIFKLECKNSPSIFV